jgi:hypothetical protein
MPDRTPSFVAAPAAPARESAATPAAPSSRLTMAEAQAAYPPLDTRYLAACTSGLPTRETLTALHE